MSISVNCHNYIEWVNLTSYQYEDSIHNFSLGLGTRRIHTCTCSSMSGVIRNGIFSRQMNIQLKLSKLLSKTDEVSMCCVNFMAFLRFSTVCLMHKEC